MPKPLFVPIPKHVDGQSLYAAAERLEKRLHDNRDRIDAALFHLNPTGLMEPGYYSRRFLEKLPNVLSYLQVYVYIIGNALPNRSLSEISLLDYGGGWGLMGILAKEMGIGRVTYLDISPGPEASARTTAEVIGLQLDRYILGAEDALYACEERFDSVVSSDVLEHVYDPASVFTAIRHVCAPGARVFHHTGANPKSLHQRVTLSRLHRQEEPALRSARAQVVRGCGVTGSDIDRLAEATRGLNRRDIENAVARFIASGELPQPDHPTNTCDLTGYWLERLMEPARVAEKMGRAGYRAEVRQSFWGPGRSSRPIRAVKHALNFASSLAVPIGLRSTFYYAIAGEAA